jgi:hypothetical protein
VSVAADEHRRDDGEAAADADRRADAAAERTRATGGAAHPEERATGELDSTLTAADEVDE